MKGFMAEDHWSRNECPVRFSERPTGGVWRTEWGVPPVSDRKSQTTDRSDRVANSDHRRRINNDRIILELILFSFVFRACVRGSGRFCRSVRERLNRPFQTNRSDDTEPEIGIERKNISAFKVNMYINTFFYTSVSRKGVCRYYFRRRLSANVG